MVHNLKIDPIFGCNGWLFLNQLILVRKFQSIKEMKEPMTKTLKWIAVASVVASLTSRASHKVVDTKPMGDNKLSCLQLVAEIQEVTEFERKAQKEKGVTGTNVAGAAIF